MTYPPMCKPPTPYNTPDMNCFGCTMCGERTKFTTEPVFGGILSDMKAAGKAALSQGKAVVGEAASQATNAASNLLSKKKK